MSKDKRRGPGGGRRARVGERRRAAASQALGIGVSEKRTMDAANERSHELYGLGIGVLVMESQSARQRAVSLIRQMESIPRWRRLLSGSWWSLRRQAKAAIADAEVWEERLAHVARDLTKRGDFDVAASPGER